MNSTESTTEKPNLDFVTPRLAVGGDLDTLNPSVAIAQLAAIGDLGITHIVDCRLEWTDEEFVADHAPGIRYLHNPTDDDGLQRPDEFFDQGVEFTAGALAQERSKVLIHCHMGVNRAPSLAFAVMLHTGHDPLDAIVAIRGSRPVAATGYAQDALSWHLRRSAVDPDTAVAERRRLRAWLDDNAIDATRLIRQIRRAEADDL